MQYYFRELLHQGKKNINDQIKQIRVNFPIQEMTEDITGKD